jgi:hypothetical protein
MLVFLRLMLTIKSLAAIDIVPYVTKWLGMNRAVASVGHHEWWRSPPHVCNLI